MSWITKLFKKSQKWFVGELNQLLKKRESAQSRLTSSQEYIVRLQFSTEISKGGYLPIRPQYIADLGVKGNLAELQKLREQHSGNIEVLGLIDQGFGIYETAIELKKTDAQILEILKRMDDYGYKIPQKIVSAVRIYHIGIDRGILGLIQKMS